MLDKELRKLKDFFLIPAAKLIGRRIHPIVITVFGFFVGAAAVFFIYRGFYLTALWLWVANRILDGLDGLVARYAGKKTDIGGFLDIVADFFIYAAIPLAFAFQAGSLDYFMISALLLASFYVNASIWMSVSALLEKHNCVDDSRETSLNMPRGLIEGFETIIFYTLMFIFPSSFILIAGIMAGLLGFGIILRLFQGIKLLIKIGGK